MKRLSLTIILTPLVQTHNIQCNPINLKYDLSNNVGMSIFPFLPVKKILEGGMMGKKWNRNIPIAIFLRISYGNAVLHLINYTTINV